MGRGRSRPGGALIRKTQLHRDAAAFDFWKEIAVDIRVGNDIDRLPRLDGPVGDVARQGALQVVEKIVIDEDPFSSAGPVADRGAPDKFGFADPLPYGVGAPG